MNLQEFLKEILKLLKTLKFMLLQLLIDESKFDKFDRQADFNSISGSATKDIDNISKNCNKNYQ